MKTSFIKVKHSNKCFAKGSKQEWSGLIKRHYWGNFAGTENADRRPNHIWHEVICNDPSCPGIKAVHSSVLSNA